MSGTKNGEGSLVLDSTGNILSKFNYEPYGVELPSPNGNVTNEKYKYTGQERDYDTGMDYMHFRYYASSMGRFMKPDNMITNVMNSQSWNLYSYVNGNPVNYNDPTGHSARGGMTDPTYIGTGFSWRFIASADEAAATFSSFGMSPEQIGAAMSGKVVAGSSFGSVSIASVSATRSTSIAYSPYTGKNESTDKNMVVHGDKVTWSVHYNLIIDLYDIPQQASLIGPPFGMDVIGGLMRGKGYLDLMNSLLKSPCVSSWDGVPPPKADELARDRENPGRKPVGSLYFSGGEGLGVTAGIMFNAKQWALYFGGGAVFGIGPSLTYSQDSIANGWNWGAQVGCYGSAQFGTSFEGDKYFEGGVTPSPCAAGTVFFVLDGSEVIKSRQDIQEGMLFTITHR